MHFTGFEHADFDVFAVPGLDGRMAALKAHLRPKLQQLGVDFEERLGSLVQRPMYAHVAKHARRTVNPPNDSWVAFCADKRGYKKHPHFQIGAWGTHAFALFGLIYESPARGHYASQLEREASRIVKTVPGNYVWVPNHMDTNAFPAREVDESTLRQLAAGLRSKRQGELLVGITVPRDIAVAMSATEFVHAVADCFQTLLPLYELANTEEMGVQMV